MWRSPRLIAHPAYEFADYQGAPGCSRRYARRHASVGSIRMSDPTIDALALGQQVVAVLETGLRTATYKLATLMALVDDCVEYLLANPEDELAIPITRLAGRVLEAGTGTGALDRAELRFTGSLRPDRGPWSRHVWILQEDS